MRKTLIIGINHYPDMPLESTVNDVLNMKEVFSKHEDDTKISHLSINS